MQSVICSFNAKNIKTVKLKFKFVKFEENMQWLIQWYNDEHLLNEQLVNVYTIWWTERTTVFS